MPDGLASGRGELGVMLIAGEPSGDRIAAELVSSLTAIAPARRMRLFGAGGPGMAAAGVDLAVDMTAHSIVGLAEAVSRYPTFRRLFDRLVALAVARRPDVIVCVDFSGFNRRFARAVRAAARQTGWTPRIVQYVSPQVWASRPGRARSMARDLDLLISIFPFESRWYADHAPSLRVVWVGHPLIDRYAARADRDERPGADGRTGGPGGPRIVLLPGSRPAELTRHLPVMLEAARLIRARQPTATFRAVLPDARLLQLFRAGATGAPRDVGSQAGGLDEALASADLAIASTGTVTLECAYFRVPTVAIYRTSWLTYQVGRRIVTVPHLAMPNLIAGEPLFPELVQHDATGPNIAARALALLDAHERRAALQHRLGDVVASLGPPGASRRAAEAILEIL